MEKGNGNGMPKIDLGIFLDKFDLSKDLDEIETTLLTSLNILFEKDNITFISAYLYDEKRDLGMDIFCIKDVLQQIVHLRCYNRIVFQSRGKDFFVTIGFIDQGLTIGVNLDYEFFDDMLEKRTPSQLLSFLQTKFYHLYEKVQYKFAFADGDAEFDYSYCLLLEMTQKGKYPYSLLVIDNGGHLKQYKSSYNLLGIPYDC